MNQKNAFTLAEVLITLGIIGVVAAMTMPTLLNSTQGAQYRTGFKKAMSVLSQAAVLNVALDDYDFSQTTTAGTADASNLYSLFRKRMNVAKIVTGSNAGYPAGKQNISPANSTGGTAVNTNNAGNYTFFFNDGITLSFPSSGAPGGQNGCGTEWATSNCKGYIDLNGVKNPNTVAVCSQSAATEANCQVTNPTDIYPIRMYGQTIVPNSRAARQVMYGGK